MVYMARHTGKQKGFIIGIVLLLIYLIYRYMRFSAINYKQGLRGCDAWGCGSFGSSRGSLSHRGLDFDIPHGGDVFAPFPCKVVRHGYPYSDDLSFRLIEVVGIGAYKEYRAKLMYVTELPPVGSVFHEKQKMCVADNITRRYDDRMVNHVHFELYANDELVNPEIFF